MLRLTTRDIGTKRVDALPINSSLQFEFTAPRDGHVTVLNLGTSGAMYLHVPNVHCPVGQAVVVKGETYPIPGPHLLPWDRLNAAGLEYIEAGPPGWEHVVVLLCDKPLLDKGTVLRSSPGSPLVRLTPEEFEGVCERLSSTGPSEWLAGALSFLVG